MKIIKKYKLFDNNEFIGVYTSLEISNMIEVSQNQVSVYANTQKTYKDRYYFEIAEDTDSIMKEWDEARLSILNAPDKITKTVIVKPFSIWKEKSIKKQINIKNMPLNLDK